jgi:hypothetical protein
MNVSRCQVLLATCALALTIVTSASGAATAVPLGTTGSFSVLAGAGITNTGPTTVAGDIGTFPTTSISGLGSMTVGGANHAGDAVTQHAKADLVTAYNTAASNGPTNPVTADLAGLTLLPGVYNSASSMGLSGALTLNAQGNPDSVFVFQIGSAFTSASGSRINLINGAQACNVFWQVGSSATLGTGSTFIGTILALTSITVTTGVTIDGRVLARNGAVTLDTDTINTSRCTTTPTSATPGSGTTPTTTPGSTVPAVPLTPALKKKQVLAKKRAALKKKQQQVAKKTPVSRTTTAAKPPTTTTTFGFTG